MIVCSSPEALHRRLATGAKEDVFRYEADDRTVRLDNDCRTFPLRLRVRFHSDSETQVLAFLSWCRNRYDVTFELYLEGALTTRIPGLAPKVMAFFPLGEAQVHFYKQSPLDERRRVIAWMVGADLDTVPVRTGHSSHPAAP
jgi:hypothetical protein